MNKNDVTAPVTSISSIDFKTPTISESLKPKKTIHIKITIFDIPSFTPGAINGSGIKLSITDKESAIATIKDKKESFFHFNN